MEVPTWLVGVLFGICVAMAQVSHGVGSVAWLLLGGLVLSVLWVK